MDEFTKNIMRDTKMFAYSTPTNASDVLDSTRIVQENDTDQRVVSRWVDCTAVSRCHKCAVEFNFYKRKHHCRCCGRVFCYYCSNNYMVLPVDLMGKIPQKIKTYTDLLWDEHTNSKVRVCDNCFKYIGDINRIRMIIRVFEEAELNIIELALLSHLLKDFEDAVKLLLSRFRDIQYKMSIERLTKKDKNMLWINRNFLCGHSRWMVQLIKSIDYYTPSDLTDSMANRLSKQDVVSNLVILNKKNSCRDVMCSRFCSDKIELNDAMDLIHFNHNYPMVSDIVIESLKRVDVEKIIHYIPFFVSNLTNNLYLMDHLLAQGMVDFALMNSFYWAVHVYTNDLENRKMFIMKIINHIKNSTSDNSNLAMVSYRTRFKNMLDNQDIDPENMVVLEKKQPVVLPIFPSLDIIRVDTKGIQVMASFSKPIIIPVESTDNRIHRILYKKEDIRKDHIIMCIINLVTMIIREEENIDVPTVIYAIQPITDKSGYVEIIDNAQTIFNILENSGFTIQNYIMENNKNTSIKEFRDRFILSTALYCVLSYLLGIGDRHLDNIMISSDGRLFHIDFSFILGQDPKYSNNRTIRVTPEIVNVIGGYGSDDYQKFKKYCSLIYNRMRLHVNLFSNLLSIIPRIDPTIDIDRVRSELIDRFEIGENRYDAELHMIQKVDRDGNSFEYMMIDFLYKSKNSNIVKIISDLKNRIVGMVG